jgi:hypothetical protein
MSRKWIGICGECWVEKWKLCMHDIHAVIYMCRSWIARKSMQKIMQTARGVVGAMAVLRQSLRNAQCFTVQSLRNTCLLLKGLGLIAEGLIRAESV